MGVQCFEGRLLLAELTTKQREVMDLLIEHRTSKEIARLLGISPHTVDQRIRFARDKLGASSRNEAAAIYRRLLETYQQMTYGNSGLDAAMPGADVDLGTQGPLRQCSQSERVQTRRPDATEAEARKVPELFDGPNGMLMRFGAIAAIAAFLIMIVTGVLAIVSLLTELVAE